MSSIISCDGASTPLTHEELEDLKLSYVTTRDDLNEAEQSNILEAQAWALKRKRDVLNEKFLKSLHKRMFLDVWKWAGTYRKTPRNIGVEAYRISTDLNALISDVTFWLGHHTYPMKEIAVRFHHRLVYIHPFPNGNGRWGRLATDIFLTSQDAERFPWGVELDSASSRRASYVSALRSADEHDIQLLLDFVTG